MPLPATQEYCLSGKPVRCLIRNNARGKTCPRHHIACWRKPPCMRVAIRFRGRPEPPSPDRSAIAMRPEFDPHIWKTMHHVDRPAWQGCIALRHIQHSAQSVSRSSTIEAGSWKKSGNRPLYSYRNAAKTCLTKTCKTSRSRTGLPINLLISCIFGKHIFLRHFSLLPASLPLALALPPVSPFVSLRSA